MTPGLAARGHPAFPQSGTLKPAREPLPDALRALALIAVLVVNTLGYPLTPVGPQLGLRLPADSAWAAACT